MKFRGSTCVSDNDILYIKNLYRLSNSYYCNRTRANNMTEENTDGKKSFMGLLPSAFSEIKEHITKSEADLIHV